MVRMSNRSKITKPAPEKHEEELTDAQLKVIVDGMLELTAATKKQTAELRRIAARYGL